MGVGDVFVWGSLCLHDALPISFVFFFNDTATTEIYTLSLHDALPIPASPPPTFQQHFEIK